MRIVLRNVLALVVGIVIGSAINLTIITLGASAIPPPPGVDIGNPESLATHMHLFDPQHFLMPFLAHALGTLFGALATYLVAASHAKRLAYVIGAVFLLGGVAASFMIPAPGWFIALDLLLAYLPMAWLGARLGARITKGTTTKR